MLNSWCFVVAAALLQEQGLAVEVEEQVFYRAELDEIELVELHEVEGEFERPNSFPLLEFLTVDLDGEGEAWIFRSPNQTFAMNVEVLLSGATLSVRAPNAESITGRIMISFRGGERLFRS